jgi:hypothetical protein
MDSNALKLFFLVNGTIIFKFINNFIYTVFVKLHKISFVFLFSNKLNPASAVSKDKNIYCTVHHVHTAALANPERIVLFSIFIYVWIAEKCGYVSGAGL